MNNNQKVSILIVDDQPKNIFALEQMLAKPGRTFISATDGVAALKIALNRSIDLIILDVHMPGMDGFEVTQILKTNKRTKDIPIIFASAEKKEKEFVMKGFEEGGIDYLHKPLDPKITEAKVSVLLRLHLQKKELIAKNATLEQYALLINNSADLICIINAESLKFEQVNQAVKTLLGYTTEEIKGTSLLFYLKEEDRQRVQKLSKENKEKFSFEASIYCKERTVKWLNWNIVNKNGFWFANARDITETKDVEEIKNYLSTVVKQSNEAIYLHDQHGKIISWNEGATEIYGYTEAEALKMKIWNIIPEHLLQEAQEKISKIMQGEKIIGFETKRITKHRKIIDVLFSASVLLDVNNNLKSIAITERDITLQKRSEEQIKQLNADLQKNISQLKEREEQIQTIFRNAPEAVIVIDEEGKITSWNPMAEAIFGWTPDEVIGQYLHETIIPQRFREAHLKGLKHFLKTGEGPILNKPLELQACKKDSTEIDVGLRISQTYLKGKYYFIGFVSDITFRKKAEVEIRQKKEQLEAINKELESFSYSVSHDLRAPLRSINGYAQIILEEHQPLLNDELKRLFGIIQNNAKRMGTLIDDLLAFSRLGRRSLTKTPVNFNDLVHQVVKDLEVTFHANTSISIHPLKFTEGDQTLLYQVFANLISNAIKYSGKKETPRIEIGFLENDDEYIYYVSDNGAGFNMEYAHKLFGVFQRLHSNEEFEGTGVGLAIVQRIIAKHGGRVWAEGEIDKGATFYFSLPKPITR